MYTQCKKKYIYICISLNIYSYYNVYIPTKHSLLYGGHIFKPLKPNNIFPEGRLPVSYRIYAKITQMVNLDPLYGKKYLKIRALLCSYTYLIYKSKKI